MSDLVQKNKLAAVLAIVEEYNATCEKNQRSISDYKQAIQTAIDGIEAAQKSNEIAKDNMINQINNII